MGIPCAAKIFFRWMIITADVVVFRITTSGHRVHASSHTSGTSPVGNSPHKSICMSCQDLFGMVVGLRGSGAAFGAIDWHGKQDLIINSISRSIPGHQTFYLTTSSYEQLLGDLDAHFSKCLHEDIQVVRSLSHAEPTLAM